MKWPTEWWSGKVSTAPIFVARTILGVSITFTATSLLVEWRLWFLPANLQSPEARGLLPTGVALYDTLIAGWAEKILPDQPIAILAALLTALAAGVLLACGWRQRAMGAVALVALLLIQHQQGGIVHSGDRLLLLLLWGATMASDTRGAGHMVIPATSKAYGQRFMQIQMSIMYLFSGLEKARGAEWRNGTAIWTVLHTPVMTRFHLAPGMPPQAACQVAGLALVGLEIALGGLFLYRGKALKTLLPAAVLLHISIYLSIYTGSFQLIAIAGLAAALPEEWAGQISRRILALRQLIATAAT